MSRCDMAEEKLQQLMKLTGRENIGFPSNYTAKDAEGNEMKLYTMDGKLFPAFGEESFRKLKDVQLRDDDILLCGYPKTGCHWAWEILCMVIQRKAELSQKGKLDCFLELIPIEFTEVYPSPRILNTHVFFEYLPKQIFEKKTKLILTVRNPKDVAVSLYHHHLATQMYCAYNGPFKSWFKLFLDGEVDYGSYSEYYLDWEKAIQEHPDQPILVVSYDDMKADLPREIRKMSKFLQVDLDDQLVEDIAKAAGFDIMKKAYGKSGIFSNQLLRKGEVGDWKNWLTVAQNEAVDAMMENVVNGTRFKPRYTI